MQYKFPDDFKWGSASSAMQQEGGANEGGREPSVWDKYFELSPHRFFDGVGPSILGDFYNRYKEDIALMKQMGLNSYRTSIQWGRLLPYGAKEPASDAVRFYNNLINTLLENGIEPYICLHHFDLPWSKQEIGGWENRAITDDFAYYANICFKLFGDRVKKWFTFNEPIAIPLGGYMGGDASYPNVADMSRSMTTMYHQVIAHSKAVDCFRAGGYVGKIGIILDALAPSYPRSLHPSDVNAAKLFDLVHSHSFKDPCLKGIYNQELIDFMASQNMALPIEVIDKELIAKGKVDIVGVNYYVPSRIKAKEHLVNPEAPVLDTNFYDRYALPGCKMNVHRGWEIYAKAIYDTLIDIRDNYENVETFIGENGMGVQDEDRFRNSDGYIEDDYRIDFIKEHLSYLHQAITEGCNCKGYHFWTFVDSWSWQNAYKNRYGFIELQRHNGLKRVMKKSGYWMKTVTKACGFEWDRPKEG